jgi:hypothetical protein
MQNKASLENWVGDWKVIFSAEYHRLSEYSSQKECFH